MYIRYDHEKLNGILRDLSILTGISIDFLNAAGEREPICSFRRTDDFCSAYQKQHGWESCRCSDYALLERCRASGRLEGHICHAGLYDAAMPVTKSGITVGYILLGRLRTVSSSAYPACRSGGDALAGLYEQTPFLNDVQLTALQGLLSNIFFSNAIEIEHNELAEAISGYIDAHLADDLSVSALCERFFVSRNSLYKCFHAHYGVTVNEYITQERLARAKKLLAETNKNLGGICEAVGVQNESYFCRLFKKHSGLSPTAYRRAAKQTEGMADGKSSPP